LDDVKKYYNTYWKPNVAYLVFVGDITPANAQKLATQYFGKWKRGMVPKTKMPIVNSLNKNIVAIIDRPSSVQSVISIGNSIQLKPGNADVIPVNVMNDILGGGSTGYLYKTLREKYGFTYGAYSSTSEDKYVGRFRAGASVRNEKTDSAIQEFMSEFKHIRNSAASKEDVDQIKSSLAGDFARSFESPSTIAQFALSTAINNLPPNYYQDYLTNLSKVNAASVQQMANKYVGNNNMYIVIVGNAKEIAKGLEKYGEIKYFDLEGNEAKPATSKAVDASVTAESIINKYVDVIGGKAAIESIKDFEMQGKAEIPGAPFKPDVKRMTITNAAYMDVVSAMNGAMVIQKKSLINGVYKEEGQMKQAGEMDDEDKEEIDEELVIVNELYYIKNGYTFTVKSIENVEGSDAYEVAIKSKKGRVFTNYYDVKTGLKVKTVAMAEDPETKSKIAIPTYFGDYKPFNGIQFPTKVTMEQGVKIVVTFDSIKVNSGLKTEDLK
jgi:zinc protease